LKNDDKQERNTDLERGKTLDKGTDSIIHFPRFEEDAADGKCQQKCRGF